MNDDEKNAAEVLIMKKLNNHKPIQQNHHRILSKTTEQQTHHPIDMFLAECGVLTNSVTSKRSVRRIRSVRDELTLYMSMSDKSESFESFWTGYQFELPLLINLVR